MYDRQAVKHPTSERVVIIDEGMEDAACRSLANLKATTG
jgi:hypothetical protein